MKTTGRLTILLIGASYCVNAFLQPIHKAASVQLRSANSLSLNLVYPSSPSFFVHSTRSSTHLFLYNLPPEDDNNNGLGQLLPSIISLLALGLFFFSPLGALFFAVTNTLLAFTIFAPFILYIGFQVWQYFYTIEGPCPACGSPVRVLKDVQQPSICFNCGSQVISNTKMDGVELYDDVDNILDRQRSLWDSLFSNEEPDFASYRSTTTSSDTKENMKRSRREQTIIDVDVSEE